MTSSLCVSDILISPSFSQTEELTNFQLSCSQLIQDFFTGITNPVGLGNFLIAKTAFSLAWGTSLKLCSSFWKINFITQAFSGGIACGIEATSLFFSSQLFSDHSEEINHTFQTVILLRGISHFFGGNTFAAQGIQTLVIAGMNCWYKGETSQGFVAESVFASINVIQNGISSNLIHHLSPTTSKFSSQEKLKFSLKKSKKFSLINSLFEKISFRLDLKQRGMTLNPAGANMNFSSLENSWEMKGGWRVYSKGGRSNDKLIQQKQIDSNAKEKLKALKEVHVAKGILEHPLRTWREDKGCSIYFIGALLYIEPSSVSFWERYEGLIQPHHIKQLKVWGAPVDLFLDQQSIRAREVRLPTQKQLRNFRKIVDELQGQQAMVNGLIDRSKLEPADNLPQLPLLSDIKK